MIKIYQDLLLNNGLIISIRKDSIPNTEIRIKTSDQIYIVVKGDITLEGDNDANKRNKNLAFRNNAPFINCISKINGIKIDNAEDLDV